MQSNETTNLITLEWLHLVIFDLETGNRL